MGSALVVAIERRPGGYGLALCLPLAGRLFGLGGDLPDMAAAKAAAEREATERGAAVEDRTEAVHG